VRRLLLALGLVLALLAAGCGGDDEATTTDTDTVTTPAETVQARVYLLHEGQVWPVAREIDAEGQVNAALSALLEGPTDEERADLDFATAIPDDVEGIEVSPIADAVPRLEISGGDVSDEALAQIVYTATQFPGFGSVEYQGRTLGRSDFEEQTPLILVESPLPFEAVTSPVHASGTANTFEATFNYELTDTDGKIVDEDFVTATSGTGTRGTFEFTTDDFTVPFDGIGSLIVFELSAEDGSRIHLMEIPLAMSK
jgi:hypothetical protein